MDIYSKKSENMGIAQQLKIEWISWISKRTMNYAFLLQFKQLTNWQDINIFTNSVHGAKVTVPDTSQFQTWIILI